jgi:hypothetical protein
VVTVGKGAPTANGNLGDIYIQVGVWERVVGGWNKIS